MTVDFKWWLKCKLLSLFIDTIILHPKVRIYNYMYDNISLVKLIIFAIGDNY